MKILLKTLSLAALISSIPSLADSTPQVVIDPDQKDKLITLPSEKKPAVEKPTLPDAAKKTPKKPSVPTPVGNIVTPGDNVWN